jgi:DNA-binding response OmpR family regulator
MANDPKKPLGRILLQQRTITEQELTRALHESRASGQPLATQLTEQGALSEIEALKALSEQSGVPGIDLSQVCIRLSDLSILPREVALRHRLLPVLARDDRLFVAMATPTDKKVIDEVEFVTGKRVFAYIALAGPLQKATAVAYNLKDRGETHYVGPACPAEVMRKAGIAPREEPPPAQPPTPAPQAHVPPQPAHVPPPAERTEPRVAPPAPSADEFVARRQQAQPQPLIVDDAMGRMAAADDLTDAGFGDANRDLSVVGQLPRENPAQAGQRTILVVDDEADIRKLLRRVLEARGHRVIEADRGLLALRMVKEHAPDLLILDAMLPEVHGFDIARRIKGSERYGHIPIVMISAVYRGWRFAEDVKTSYGVDAYIEKPFKVSEAIAAIESALSRGSAPLDTEQVSADAEQHLALGIQAYQAGEIDQAIEHLRRGTRVDPLAYRLHFHLGLLYGKKDQVYDAIQELETALQMNGGHFPALKNLAVLYQKAGLRNKAVETWERALRVAPDDATKLSIKEHLLGLL